MSCTLGQVLPYATVWFYHTVSKMQHKIHFSYCSEDHLTLAAASDNCRVEIRHFQTAKLSPPRLNENGYVRMEKKITCWVNMSSSGMCCPLRLVSIKEASEQPYKT